MDNSQSSPSSARVALGRYPARGRYDFATIAAILDEGLVCHLAVVKSGQPVVIPTTYARVERDLYVHGSPVAGWLRVAAGGIPICVTVTLLDGLVLARSAFHHSMNYRSVVVMGKAQVVGDPAEKNRALEALVEHIVPGRWQDSIRRPTPAELANTLALRIPLEEASAKIRTGPPIDSESDMALPVWAGVLPLVTVAGAALSDRHLPPTSDLPGYVANYRRPAKV